MRTEINVKNREQLTSDINNFEIERSSPGEGKTRVIEARKAREPAAR